MLSLIVGFKDFVGMDKVHQRSAIFSWLGNGIPVFTINNEPHIQSNCKDFTIVSGKTAQDIGFNHNSPLLKDLLLSSLLKIKTPMVGLINGDILISPDFMNKLKMTIEYYGQEIFLSGIRHDFDLKKEIVTKKEWEDLFKKEIPLNRDRATCADIFISTTENFRRMALGMPDLIMGRYGWDNWIHYWAVSNVALHYNCTKALPIIHCMHDHGHIEKQEKKYGRRAPSSQHNLNLLKDIKDLYKETLNKWPQIIL